MYIDSHDPSQRWRREGESFNLRRDLSFRPLKIGMDMQCSTIYTDFSSTSYPHFLKPSIRCGSSPEPVDATPMLWLGSKMGRIHFLMAGSTSASWTSYLWRTRDQLHSRRDAKEQQFT